MASNHDLEDISLWQYFTESLVARFDIKFLPMGGFPYDLVLIGVWVVERYMVFTVNGP